MACLLITSKSKSVLLLYGHIKRQGEKPALVVTALYSDPSVTWFVRSTVLESYNILRHTSAQFQRRKGLVENCFHMLFDNPTSTSFEAY